MEATLDNSDNEIMEDEFLDDESDLNIKPESGGQEPRNEKVRFSIRYKLLFLIIFLEVITLTIFLVFTITTFKKDKSAYIYETALSNVESLSRQLESHVDKLVLQIEALGESYDQNDITEFTGRFYAIDGLFEFSIYNYNGGKEESLQYINNESYLNKFGVDKNFLDEVARKHKLFFPEIIQRNILFKNTSIGYGIPHITMAKYDRLSNRFYIARISMNSFLDIISSSKMFNTFGIDLQAKTVISNNEKFVLNNSSLAKQEHIRNILEGDIISGVKEYNKDQTQEEMILGFNKIKAIDLVFFSEISKDVAFNAINDIIQRTLFFGGFIVFLSIIIGVYTSRTLINPLSKLFDVTKFISTGDFSKKAHIKTNDEIGVLANSFNLMIDKITYFLEEVKEKTRMQGELEVAKLVQESFFPSFDYSFDQFELTGHYQSASECGGDWWGAFRIENKVMVLIGDATGHGVPAALITATVNGCTSAIIELASKNPLILNDPATILKLFNKAVCGVGGKIHMTFIASVLDLETNTLRYANASHNPPYLYKGDDPKNAKKKDITVLMAEPGNRLGHEIDSTYTNDEVKIDKDHFVVFFTDGLVEAMNPDGKEYGERRFIKSITNNAAANVQIMKQNILQDAYDFYEGVPPDDDVTLVFLKHT
jgi:sigma-B regulation protein RsbU (phosphoserine phosphatase)